VHVEQMLHVKGQAIPSFKRWLRKHAEQLESLQLSHSHRSSDVNLELQLPWDKLTKLQRLQLKCCKLQLPSEGDSSCSTPPRGVGAASSSSYEDGTGAPAPLLLPSLQHLELTVIKFDSISSLQQLAAGAPGLTCLKTSQISFVQLDFCSYVCARNSAAAAQQLAAAIPGLLQHLPRVAVLELPGFPMSAAAMQQLGGMRELRHVSLTQVPHMPMCELQHLPSSITQLELRGNMYGDGVPPYSTSLPDELLRLSGVLHLKLQYCYIPPTVLARSRASRC
jgi:hypothetical protein